ncbi:hypothetical protein [Deinococcus multiflagellatus]|uniref:Uncharacterized protein n=1 Tax=Deinococcus multiflagellatus TaxID=1656887 RepID=A0ABW1ZQH9_9DEIO|nr:hypothetical protein [Deinococcus multiflagellatus]MBZ9715292.1 hypothetical protein [Deinococcus multiflagellatus]
MNAPKVISHALAEHPLSHLVTLAWDRNPRRHDLEAIAASLGKYGYNDPILIDVTSDRIASGHGVLASLLILQADGGPAPANVTVRGEEWYVTCVHVKLAPGAVEGYALAETRTRELGAWDDALLLDVLSELSAIDPTLYGTGFTPQDLEALTAKVGGELPASFHEVPDPVLPPPGAVPPQASTGPAPAAAASVASSPGQHVPAPLPEAPAGTRLIICPHCQGQIQA